MSKEPLEAWTPSPTFAMLSVILDLCARTHTLSVNPRRFDTFFCVSNDQKHNSISRISDILSWNKTNPVASAAEAGRSCTLLATRPPKLLIHSFSFLSARHWLVGIKLGDSEM